MVWYNGGAYYHGSRHDRTGSGMVRRISARYGYRSGVCADLIDHLADRDIRRFIGSIVVSDASACEKAYAQEKGYGDEFGSCDRR